MCGIVCDLKQKNWMFIVLEMSKIIRHRGPDWSGIYVMIKAIMSHERLAIVDPASGKQPLLSEDGKVVLAANEIYNHRELRKQFEKIN
jgi:asparagine synthase (glutamine-hydrolysing)